MRDVPVAVPGGSINAWYRPPRPGQPTAVLIPGLTGTSRWWSIVIEHLPEDLGLIAIDVRGRGASVEAPPPFDLVTASDDVVRCLDHFELETAIVAGYSMGGWIAAIFANRYPERVRNVVLVDGGFALPRDPDADADEVIRSVVGPSLARLDIEFPDREAFYDYWAAHPALEHHWDDSMRAALDFELAESEQGLKVRINPTAVTESARQITVDTKTNSAGRQVSVPAHLIVVERGTADQEGGMIPLATAERAAVTMPNLTMEYLPAVNHYTLLLGVGAPAVAAAIAR